MGSFSISQMGQVFLSIGEDFPLNKILLFFCTEFTKKNYEKSVKSPDPLPQIEHQLLDIVHQGPADQGTKAQKVEDGKP